VKKARLTLKVRAGARKTEFAGKHGDDGNVWKLRVAAPPVDGKANEAIIRFLAKVTGVSTSSIRIVSGVTGTTKLIELSGIDQHGLERAILESSGHRQNPGSFTPAES
jgi:uncharacterized protein (TIGR00251 family)